MPADGNDIPPRVLGLSMATPPRPPLAGRLMSWADRRNNLLFELTRLMAADWLLNERRRVAKSSGAKRLRLYDKFLPCWKNIIHTVSFPSSWNS